MCVVSPVGVGYQAAGATKEGAGIRNDEREKRASEDTHLSTSLDGVKFISESLDTGICLDSGSYRPVKVWPEVSNYDLLFLVKSFYALRESLRFPSWRRRGIGQHPQDGAEY